MWVRTWGVHHNMLTSTIRPVQREVRCLGRLHTHPAALPNAVAYSFMLSRCMHHGRVYTLPNLPVNGLEKLLAVNGLEVS